MDVLEEDIEDDKSSVRDSSRSRANRRRRAGVPHKASIAFSMKECSGACSRRSRASRGDINLAKVESRPMRWDPVTQRKDGRPSQFSYLFYVDFERPCRDEERAKRPRAAQENATFLGVLESCPADDSRL